MTDTIILRTHVEIHSTGDSDSVRVNVNRTNIEQANLCDEIPSPELNSVRVAGLISSGAPGFQGRRGTEDTLVAALGGRPGQRTAAQVGGLTLGIARYPPPLTPPLRLSSS